MKRQPRPAEERRAKYDAPAASRTAIGRVKALLEQVTEGARDDLAAYFEQRWTAALDGFLRAQEQANAKGTPLSPSDHFGRSRSPHFDPDALAMADAVLKNERGRVSLLVYRAGPGAQETVAKEARRIADEVRTNFVYKNLGKLGSIVDARSDLVGGEVIGREISLGGLRGAIRFTFADGARLTVRNAIVWSRSVHNRAFQRFPLTFHDVFLAEGGRMARPSEKRMNTVFAASAQKQAVG